jgi:S1-C subfamily serine protease
MKNPFHRTYRSLTGLVIATLLIAACTNDANRSQGQPQSQAAPATSTTVAQSAGATSTTVSQSSAATSTTTTQSSGATSTTGTQSTAAAKPTTETSAGGTSAGATPAPAAQSSGAAAAAPPAATAVRTSAQAAPGSTNPAATVYQQNGASVVNITSIAVVRTRQGRTAQPQGIGSGFILDVDGRIITNNHVVQDADELTVTFQDKVTTPAKLVGRDPDNDLAVIQVDPNAQDDRGGTMRARIKPVTLANSDEIAVGDTAIAIGSPLGLQQTVTEGIVSALRDPGEESPAPDAQLDLLGGAVQTDAAINPGNSGGPLFNASGRVMGVNSAILSQSGGNEGIGFAIPTNTVTRVVPELIQTGTYRHPLLGVTTLPLSQIGQVARQQLGIPPNQNGLLVVAVMGPAQQAGIRAGNKPVNIGGDTIPAGGDIIVAIDGRPVTSSGELRAYIENSKHPGDPVTVTVLRDGQRQDVQVTLGERPPQQQQPQPAGR